MPEPGFTPYVPRRLRAQEPERPRQAADCGRDSDEPPVEPHESERSADAPTGHSDNPCDIAVSAPAADAPDAPPQPAPTAVSAMQTDSNRAAAGDPAAALGDAIAGARRLADIRNEAVRLAAIACGKALRRAMLLDPALLARFVDEALSAAHAPDGTVVRLNPKDVACGAPPHVDTISDPSLARGEFTIDTAAGSISGALERRAALLVQAASHASH